MKRSLFVAIALVSICLLASGDVWARGGHGGGGGGGRGGGGARGGGMSRSAAGRSPSMSRPSGGSFSGRSGSSTRTSVGGRSGGGQLSRQGNRSSLSNLPTPSRPGNGINVRPSGSGSGRDLAAGRGGTGSRTDFGARPSRGQLNDFLDLGGSGSRPSFNRPSTLPGREGGQISRNAAYDFLNERPGNVERPSTLPGRPGTGTGRPGPGDLAVGDRRPGDGRRTGDIGRPGRPGDNVRPGEPGDIGRPGRPGDNQNRPLRPDNRPGRPGQGGSGERWRPGDGHHRPDRNPNWNQWQDWRHDRWTDVNKYWRNNWNHYDRYFRGDWCYHHPYWHWRPGFNYWGWATWPAVVSWFPWGWSQPIYYNYGSNVYYDGDTVYYGTTPVASAADYANQAEQIATSVPETPPPADSWMPLGVFAVTPDGDAAGSDPTLFLQLAVSKDGVIAGTLKNTVSDTTKSVEGMVDRQTQRAAWTEVGQTRPIMETGIGNLTQDTTPVLVHYADGSTQQWLLVRMDPPPETAGDAATGANSALPPQ